MRVVERTKVTDPEHVYAQREIIKEEEVIDEVPPREEYQTKKTIFRTYQVVWYILGAIEILLAFRVFLKLIGANLSGFTALVYALSAAFAFPFAGTIPATVLGDSVMEWSSLLAMLVWPILAYGIIRLFQFIKPAQPEEVEEEVDRV